MRTCIVLFLKQRSGGGGSPFLIGRAKGFDQFIVLVATEHAWNGAFFPGVDFIQAGDGPVVAALGGKGDIRVV